MDWSKIGSLIRGVAPSVAGMLPIGGPLAKVATEIILDAVGLDESADEDTVVKALMSGDPEIARKLKAAEQNHAQTMKKLGIDLERVYAEDRANARQREVDLARATGGKTARDVLYISLFFLFIGTGMIAGSVACFVYAKDFSHGDALLVQGVNVLAWVSTYWLGTSRSSGRKTELMAKGVK